MKTAPFAALVLLALAGCGPSGQDAPPAGPTRMAVDDAPPPVPIVGEEVRILAFGDSLLTGYGLDDGKDYPTQLESALRARGINARVVNAGVSGDTTAAGLQRLDFALDGQDRSPSLVLISLGGNDMLRGIDPAATRSNLDAMLDKLDARGIPVLLLGMLAAPNMGKDYETAFNAIYPSLARKHDAALVPFFLKSVIDKPDMVQMDRIHPTARGIDAMVASTVDDVSKAILKLDTQHRP